MKAASLRNSERLQRVDALLADGLPHSTMHIIQEAEVCAVNSIIAELRANGRTISCTRQSDIWLYQMEVDHDISS